MPVGRRAVRATVKITMRIKELASDGALEFKVLAAQAVQEEYAKAGESRPTEPQDQLGLE